ncbi:MAG: nodulation protein NfeD [Candidatus Thermoplasmatota archaeon]|nr:nodulation protein NfeD [Candidatus Thermoplasmatota archaeon]
MKQKIYFVFLFFLLFFLITCKSSENSNVLVVEINGTINQSTVEILKESIKEAEDKNSEAIILLLNTPGGGLSETFEIAELINQSIIPVVGFVYPIGSAAWSAGTFILISTHIAAMSDYCVIGSAQPVEITFEGTKLVNDSKTINALVKWIETRAEMYGRNKTIVGKFIKENLGLNSTMAREYGVIEFLSNSIEQLLSDINGTVVNTVKGKVVLNTMNAKQINFSPSIGIMIMKFLSNPVLTSILLMIGIFALIFGISSPGYGAEVFGIIAILLSLVGSGFEISSLSIIFLITGSILLFIEIFGTPGFGVIGIGGLILLIIGSIFLIPSYSTKEWAISMNWINDLITFLVVVVIFIALFFVFLLYKIIQAKKKKASVGTFIGEEAKTIDEISPDKPGFVRFKGEYWQATSDTIIKPNTKVIIVGREESVLKVKIKDQEQNINQLLFTFPL